MWLWIAFKFVSLYRMTQLYHLFGHHRLRCELLSNLYLCIGWHSLEDLLLCLCKVVNCFQIYIFVSDDTAKTVQAHCWCSCELLSNLYLCIGWHSWRYGVIITWLLWIAFKFVSLYRMTQRAVREHVDEAGCELLSNLYLCIGWHSGGYRARAAKVVVNCFQICIFVSDDTAWISYLTGCFWLWIAFKFVSLYRMTQQVRPACR